MYLVVVQQEEHILQLRHQQQEGAKHTVSRRNARIVLLVILDDKTSEHRNIQVHQRRSNHQLLSFEQSIKSTSVQHGSLSELGRDVHGAYLMNTGEDWNEQITQESSHFLGNFAIGISSRSGTSETHGMGAAPAPPTLSDVYRGGIAPLVIGSSSVLVHHGMFVLCIFLSATYGQAIHGVLGVEALRGTGRGADVERLQM